MTGRYLSTSSSRYTNLEKQTEILVMKKFTLIRVFTFKILLASTALFAEQKADIQENKGSQEANTEFFAPKADKPKSDMSVVVTASRGMEQDPLDVPQSISIITSEEIESTVYTDVNHILRKLPNVGLAQASQPFSASQGGSRSSNYWNEGFSIRGLGNQRVLVLTDGVRQSGQGIGYGGGNLSLYDVYSIQDIEVLKGPGSVLYGTDAFGGVVSVTTRNPKRRDAPGYNVMTRYAIDGSRNFNRVGGMVDVGNENWGLVLGGSYTDAGDPNLPKGYFPNGGSFKRAGGWMKLDYFFKGNNRIRFIANETKNTHVSIAGETIAGRPLDFTIPLYERAELGVELLAEDVSEHIEELKAGFFWQGIRRKMDNGTPFHNFRTGKITMVGMPPAVAPVVGLDTSRVKTNDKVNTFEFQPQARLDYDPHTLTVGADFGYDNAKLKDTRTEKVNSYAGVSGGSFVTLTPPFAVMPPVPPLPAVGSTTAGATTTIADAEQYRMGVYAQDNWEMDPFEIVLGGRVDLFDVKDEVGSKTHKNDAGFSGSVGLVYHYTQDTSYYCNLATGWRAPDLGERFQSRVLPFFADFTVVGNPNLDPERSYAFEVGTKSRYNKYVQYSFATFINQIDDFIGLTGSVPVRGNFTRWTYNNVGSVFLYGLEGSVLVTPTPEWELYLNGGRTYTSDSNKIAIPNWAFNYGTSYTFFPEFKYVETIIPGINGRTVLESHDSLNNTNFGGFSYFDVQVTFGLNTDTRADAQFIVGVKNIFDKPYREPFFNGFAPGRGVFASIQVDF